MAQRPQRQRVAEVVPWEAQQTALQSRQTAVQPLLAVQGVPLEAEVGPQAAQQTTWARAQAVAPLLVEEEEAEEAGACLAEREACCFHCRRHQVQGAVEATTHYQELTVVGPEAPWAARLLLEGGRQREAAAWVAVASWRVVWARWCCHAAHRRYCC